MTRARLEDLPRKRDRYEHFGCRTLRRICMLATARTTARVATRARPHADTDLAWSSARRATNGGS